MLSTRRHTPKKINALVVDGYFFNRDLHKLLLEKDGVEVTIACDGQEAYDLYVRRCGSEYYSFIMMDVQLPVMDGFTVTKKIREWEKKYYKKNVDICFASGEYFNEEGIITGLKAKTGLVDTTGILYLRKAYRDSILEEYY